MSTNFALQDIILFQNIPEDIRSCALTKHYCDSTEYIPSLTGITPYVVLIAEIDQLNRKLGCF